MFVVATRIGTTLDKGPYNFSKPTLRCKTKWSQSILVLGADICAMFEHYVSDCIVSW